MQKSVGCSDHKQRIRELREEGKRERHPRPTSAALCVLVFILAGCGGGGGGGGSAQDNTPPTPIQVSPDPVATPTPVPEATPTPVPTPEPVLVSVDPGAVTVSPFATKRFTVRVDNTENRAITWNIQEGASGGTVSRDGLYTAPLTAGVYHLVSTSQADPTKTAVVTITVANQVVINPANITINVADTAGFSASIPGATEQAVSWGVLEAGGGTMTATGMYTAPRVAGTYHVMATSVVDETQSGVVTINVQSGGVTGGIR